MDNKLWEDIQAQGENLRTVVNHLFASERENINRAASVLRNDRPTVFVGVASAEYLCMPAVTHLAQHGRPASTLSGSEALYTMLPVLNNCNVIINSRSGETAEIVKLGQALVEQAVPFVAITNEPGSTLAKLAKHVVWANTRKDELVSINVVTGMMTATLAITAAFAGRLEEMKADFEQLAQAMSDVVDHASARMNEFREFFTGIRPVYLLHRGYSKGAAYNGRLVLEEIARSPAVALDAAEFRQGPNEVVDERFGAVVFVPAGKQGELSISLARDIQRSGGSAMVVGAVNRNDPALHGSVVVPIPTLNDSLRPVLEVVPVQVLAYGLAEAQGYTPGQVRYITKVIRSEEGIPNQEV